MSDDRPTGNRPIESIIAADIGSTLTHTCLIDLVEGVYRLVAQAESPTTLSGAESDVTIGLRRAIKRLEYIAQRPLLNAAEELITPEDETGAGIDALVVTSNAASPLRCTIVGLTDDLSIESAQRVCSMANVTVTASIPLGARLRDLDQRILTELRQTPPDLVLMVGGMDTGPVAPLENAAQALVTIYDDIEPERRPAIIFAGNQEARRPVADIVSTAFNFRVVDNVRPSIHTETLGELQRELAQLYERVRLVTLPGYRHLREWCASPILSTSEALNRTWRFIARRNDLPQGILGVDIGGASAHIGAARGEVCQWVLSANMGTGLGVQRVLDLSGVAAVRRWLPISLPQEEAIVRLENTILRPSSIPQAMEDVFLVHAVARQALLLTMRHLRQQYWHRPGAKLEEETTPAFDLIAARGGSLSHTPQEGLVALTLLDAIQPTGLTRLAIDWASIWPQLGAISALSPLAAAQVLERDSFRELGTLIAPVGEAPDGERALRLRIIRPQHEITELEIPAGVIQCFPLGLDEYATVEVRPSRHFDIGLGRKGYGGRAEVRGGSLGIIVDTRGRPLSLPQDAQLCRVKLQQWLGNLMNHVHSVA